MKYTTRPQQVEAIRYTGDNYDEIYKLTTGNIYENKYLKTLTLVTQEYNQHFHVGDWIVKYSDYDYEAFSDKEFRATFKEEQ